MIPSLLLVAVVHTSSTPVDLVYREAALEWRLTAKRCETDLEACHQTQDATREQLIRTMIDESPPIRIEVVPWWVWPIVTVALAAGTAGVVYGATR